MEIKKHSIPVIIGRAAVQPGTLNETSRTVSVVFSRGNQVERGGFFTEAFIEELSLKRGHVRMERLRNGAPVLNNHQSGNLQDVIGVVTSATVDGKEGRAVIQLSKREDVEPIFQDIKDGILRNISVGYRVHKFKEVGENSEGVKILRAIDWEPIEISVVPAGADSEAQIRSDNQEKNEVEVEMEDKMPPEVKEEETKEDVQSDSEEVTQEEVTEEKVEQKVSDDSTEAVEGSKEEETSSDEPKPEEEKRNNQGDKTMAFDEKKQKEIRELEKSRQLEIRKICKAGNLSEEFQQQLINEDKSIDECRTLAFEEMAKKDNEMETRSTVTVTGQDETVTRKEGMVAAILHRANPSKYELDDKSKKYAHSSLLELARTCLQSHGENVDGIHPNDIAKRALHSTSDFPEILADSFGKSLRRAYGEAPQTWRSFVRATQARDFKELSRVQLGDAPNLEKVLEHGEVTRGTIGESAEKYSVETYARIVGVTRKTIVNDDLDAFTRIPELMGRAARDLETDLVYAIVNNNPLMSDGVALFASGHANLGTAGALSETTLNELRQLLRNQVGINGRLLNLAPVTLLVPTALETAAEKLVSSISPDAAASVNPFAPGGRTPLQLVVEPRLDAVSATAHYVFASIGAIDLIEMASLQGANGPAMDTRQGFDIEGMEIKITHDVAAKAIDYRGMTKNAGA